MSGSCCVSELEKKDIIPLCQQPHPSYTNWGSQPAGSDFLSAKKKGAKKKSNFAIFFGGHEPLYCNFTQVFWTVIAEKVLMTFSYKKNPERLGDSKIKKSLWFTARLTLQQFSWSKYPKWAVEAAESVSTSGWGIDIHEVNTENRDIYGSLFPTMKTWLSFYTSHIVVFRILWTHRKYDVCFPKWCNCDWTQTPMRSSSYLLSSDLSHSTWVCQCLKISWPRNPHNRLLLQQYWQWQIMNMNEHWRSNNRRKRSTSSRRLKSREFNQILRPLLRFWHTPPLHLPFVGLTSTCREFEPGSGESSQSASNVSPRLEGSQQSDYLPLSPQKLLKETPKNTCKTNFCFTANWYILSNIQRLQLLFFSTNFLVTSANPQRWKFSKSNTASSWPTRGPPWHHHHRSVATAVATFVAGWVCRFVGRHAEPEKSIGIRVVEALQSQWPRIR